MIIKYATGIYNSVNDIDKLNNITWYISSNNPPRSTNVIIKIPTAEEIRETIPERFDRNIYGDLVYTINQANNTIAHSLTKIYGEGDVLDFNTDTRQGISIPRNNNIEMRHDLNVLDLATAGLNENDINKFNTSVNTKQSELQMQFSVIRSEISDIEIEIKETQKKLNETNKALNALVIIGDVELQQKVTAKKTEYEKQITNLATKHDELNKQLSVVVDNMLKIGMVIK